MLCQFYIRCAYLSQHISIPEPLTTSKYILPHLIPILFTVSFHDRPSVRDLPSQRRFYPNFTYIPIRYHFPIPWLPNHLDHVTISWHTKHRFLGIAGRNFPIGFFSPDNINLTFVMFTWPVLLCYLFTGLLITWLQMVYALRSAVCFDLA